MQRKLRGNFALQESVLSTTQVGVLGWLVGKAHAQDPLQARVTQALCVKGFAWMWNA